MQLQNICDNIVCFKVLYKHTYTHKLYFYIIFLVAEIISFGIQARSTSKSVIYRYRYDNIDFKIHYVLYYHGQCKSQRNLMRD